MTTHPNALLIERLYTALDRHDAATMADCYHANPVTFHDIAFQIDDKARLYGMWRMICEGESGIRVTIKNITADDRYGEARIVDTYQFGRDSAKREEGQPVVNEITSLFRFRDGLIEKHEDLCDERAWANQAMGGPKGWLAGRIRLLRAVSARRKLNKFLRKHPVPPPPAAAPGV
jgi:ketosteroid isomerase-like protein